MAEDDDFNRPMTLEDAVSSAQDIIDQLRNRWRESGLPVEVLAHAMIGSGITDLTNVRGVDATLQVLRELVGEIEKVARGRPN
jgi:hypothetical protein